MCQLLTGKPFQDATLQGVLQVGLAEMQTAVEQTGGLLVQASTFHAQAFKESFRRIFAPASDEGHLGINSNAQLEVCLLAMLVIVLLYTILPTMQREL